MSITSSEQQQNVADLNSALITTLDEAIFFTELAKHLQKLVSADRLFIRKVGEDLLSHLVVLDGVWVLEDATFDSSEGVAGHVIRTKRPYFSNNTGRDPLFTNESQMGIKGEMCIPIIVDGMILATVHFQVIKMQREFSRDDITLVLNLLNDIKRPLANIKMYLSARSLNESLLKKIEEKEKELELRIKGIQLADAFKIEEREIIGKSETIERILKITDKLAQSEANILIEGEPGSGKELVARRIHCRSSRKNNVFIVLDCSALPSDQLELELFGDEQLVSGQRRNKQGVLETANGGTLFLENILHLSSTLQLKLIQFLKDGVAHRVGGHSLYKSNVRIVAASVRQIHCEVESHKFREDLYYALSTMTLRLPALREHREDIEILSNYFLNYNKTVDKHKTLSPEALRSLQEYTWPGNIRELQNVMERSYILSDGKIVEKSHLADSVTAPPAPTAEKEEEEKVIFSEMTLEELEKRHIVFTLNHLGGNKTKTAKSLGITVKTLYNKLHSYGMIAALQDS